MNKESYDKYIEAGFIVNRAKKHSKFLPGQGKFIERKQQPFRKSYPSYSGIIPKNIIVIDADTYEADCEYNRFTDDLGYIPEPTVRTASGGMHIFFENAYPDKVVGQSTYKNVDTFAGFQQVVGIVDSVVKNKQDELKPYAWHEDNFLEEIILNPWDEKLLDLLNMRERGQGIKKEEFEFDGFENLDDENDDTVVDPVAESDGMTVKEVQRHLRNIDIPYERQSFMELSAGVFHLLKPSLRPEFKKMMLGWAKARWGDAVDVDNFNKITNQIVNQTFGQAFGGGSIVNDARKGKADKTIKDIEAVESIGDLRKMFADTGYWKNPPYAPSDDFEAVAKAIQKKAKSLDSAGKKGLHLIRDARSIVEFSIEPELSDDEMEIMVGSALYILPNGDRILHRYDNVLSPTMKAGVYKEFILASDENLTVQILKEMISKACSISEVITRANYLGNVPFKISFDKTDQHKMDALIVERNNLLPYREKYEYDEDIINEMFNDVWAGKLDKLIRLIGLTIKFGEFKLNRLMLVAPSDAGKTAVLENMAFSRFTMPRLVTAMRGTKGLGEELVKGLKASSLLLIDEANKALPAEMKDMDKRIYIDQFGQGGTQVIDLLFTVLTSTHGTATRNNSDELYNRFLQIELKKDEMEHSITDGYYFKKDREKFTNVVTEYSRHLLIDAIQGDGTRNELFALQDEFRLSKNTDLDEVLYELAEDFIKEIKHSASTSGTGDTIVWHGDYYTKRKGDVFEFFNDRLKDVEELDVGKYAERLTNHFLPDGKRKAIKMSGVAVNFYPLNLQRFTEDDASSIVEDMFEDLTEEGDWK